MCVPDAIFVIAIGDKTDFRNFRRYVCKCPIADLKDWALEYDFKAR
jgi:hypothetical protein